MIENNPNDVSSAFEILFEEVEAEIDFVNSVGARAFEARDYDKVKEAHQLAGTLTSFRDKAAGLRKEWDILSAATEREEDEATRHERRDLGKLRKGMRTPESAYYVPILQVLDRMGGSGKVAEVLDRVLVIVKPILKPVDYEPLASSPDNPRWRNAAQWARNSMINDGLLKADSPRGIWSITDAGRKLVPQQ